MGPDNSLHRYALSSEIVAVAGSTCARRTAEVQRTYCEDRILSGFSLDYGASSSCTIKTFLDLRSCRRDSKPTSRKPRLIYQRKAKPLPLALNKRDWCRECVVSYCEVHDRHRERWFASIPYARMERQLIVNPDVQNGASAMC